MASAVVSAAAGGTRNGTGTTTTTSKRSSDSSSSVFEEGPLDVRVGTVDPSQAKGLPKPLVVAAPTAPGSYPVLVFLHGFNLYNSWYRSLLSHVASHGFIAVAPQLYVPSLPSFFSLDDAGDIATTKQVTNWLAAADQGLLYVLGNVLRVPAGVAPDLSRLALAGHSRGGDTAFAVALGLRGKGDATSLDPRLAFSALVGVDPVGGLAPFLQVTPRVLTGGTIDPRAPAMVVGTGLGPQGSLLPPTLPCAPAGVNHVQFYAQCAAPKCHFVVRDYGHLDMLDDDVPSRVNCTCKSNANPNSKHTKGKCRKTIAGLVVAFLQARLEEGKGEALAALLNPPPAVLDQVEHDP